MRRSVSRQSATATICEVASPLAAAAAARCEECTSPRLCNRLMPICPALRCERFDISHRGSGLRPLFVACDRGQLGYVPQQDAAALQVQNAVLPPGLQLAVDALARCADEDAELLLRDMHLGAKIGGERAEPPREPHRQGLQHRFLHPLALPADALAEQLNDLDRDLRLALEMAEKILPPQHYQLGSLTGSRIRGTALAIEDGNLAEQIARPHEIQGQAAAIGGPGLDADLPAANPEQRIAGIALLEQHLARGHVLGVTKVRNPLELVGTQVCEHRVHFQNDRKFGLFAHCDTFKCPEGGVEDLSDPRSVP